MTRRQRRLTMIGGSLAMLAVAAKLFHATGLTGTTTIQHAHVELGHEPLEMQHIRALPPQRRESERMLGDLQWQPYT